MTKTKPAPNRSIKLLRPPSAEAFGIFRIVLDNEAYSYVFREIRCDIGGRGFIVHRLGLSDVYYVRTGEPHDCSCECWGFLKHGSCKHILGLLALEKRGLI
ncbi:MAG: SWIM zinc finger family protein [Gemmataceae bacterium]